MNEKHNNLEEQNLKDAAKAIKKHCEEHSFYTTGDCCGCAFAAEGETCPFDTGSIPADWEV